MMSLLAVILGSLGFFLMLFGVALLRGVGPCPQPYGVAGLLVSFAGWEFSTFALVLARSIKSRISGFTYLQLLMTMMALIQTLFVFGALSDWMALDWSMLTYFAMLPFLVLMNRDLYHRLTQQKG